MYKSIYAPVDNSDYSRQVAHAAIRLGKTLGAKITGSHIYAAKLHDYRFKQMEFTLPGEYRQEVELERQRKIHDSLITMGLELISDCYLDEMDKTCKAQNLPFERRMADGKHYVEILKDVQRSDVDLVILGALGLGRMKDSQIGVVCQRVAQESLKDVWVVKHLPKDDEPERDAILVGIDGSPQSFGALMTAAELAKKFDKRLEVISVYDPYLHYIVFNGIVDVLNDRAAKVFRFEEQNQLHEEVIDTGLAQIYQSHLHVAEDMVKSEGVKIDKKTLLDGKAFQKIVDYTRKNPPWLLVLGRIGVHSEKDEKMLGSNTENLLRLAPCDILLSTRIEYPELDKKAEESILWTPEAEKRMERVPEMVRGIARTGILRLAIEEGHSVITNVVIDKAMDRFMPKNVAKQTERLGEALAFERARRGDVAICQKCGISAHDAAPVKCAVCGGTAFEKVTPEMVEKIVAAEGGVQEEQTYDGRKLKWTKDARQILRLIKDMYQKRRAKALIEKSARVRKLDMVSATFAQGVLENDLTIPLTQEATDALATEFTKDGAQDTQEALSEEQRGMGLRLIARDDKRVPLLSVFEWSDEAVTRIQRVPAGFMRDRVQEQAETLALKDKQLTIELALVESGVANGLKQMEAMLAEASTETPVPTERVDPRVDNLNEEGIMQTFDRRRAEVK